VKGRSPLASDIYSTHQPSTLNIVIGTSVSSNRKTFSLLYQKSRQVY
jgi:hypothetical protein